MWAKPLLTFWHTLVATQKNQFWWRRRMGRISDAQPAKPRDRIGFDRVSLQICNTKHSRVGCSGQRQA
jgi:hypothetical protein